MIKQKRSSFAVGALLLAASFSLTACGGGSRETRVRQGSEEIGSPRTGALIVASTANVVHTDTRERIATVVRGQRFANGAFLKSMDRSGTQTALLKALPSEPETLRKLYILEGEPGINDKVVEVSATEAQRLAALYPDTGAN